MAKATAAYSCDRATAALVFGWGEAGGGNVGAARYLNGAGFLIVLLSFSFGLFHVFFYLFSLYSTLFIFDFATIRPINCPYSYSASKFGLFFKMYVPFLL